MAPPHSWRQAFFTERRLTSKLKHLVLERYVKEFAYHLGSAYTTVYYVDGFAGPGAYQRHGIPHATEQCKDTTQHILVFRLRTGLAILARLSGRVKATWQIGSGGIP